jgi:hypothetical protein
MRAVAKSLHSNVATDEIAVLHGELRRESIVAMRLSEQGMLAVSGSMNREASWWMQRKQ